MASWWTEQSGVWLVFLAVSGPIVPIFVWNAHRGRRRQAVLRTWIAITVIYSLIAAAGAIAFLAGQPKHVWIPLAYPGFFTAVPYAALYRTIRNKYVDIELRRSRARDL